MRLQGATPAPHDRHPFLPAKSGATAYMMSDLEYFDNPAGVLQGGINASLAGGSVVGAIFAGWVSNKLGRKWAIFIACCWWLVGTLLQVTTKSVGQLIVGRLLNGICVGLTSSQVPVYLAEIAKKEKRGSIICIQQVWASSLKIAHPFT